MGTGLQGPVVVAPFVPETSACAQGFLLVHEGDCSKGRGKERRGNAEEEPAHLGTTWYSADCQVTARLVEECAQGKGKAGVMSVEEPEEVEY